MTSAGMQMSRWVVSSPFRLDIPMSSARLQGMQEFHDEGSVGAGFPQEFQVDCISTGLMKGWNENCRGCRRIPKCGEKKTRFSEVRGNAHRADGKKVWFRWILQLGCISGC